MWPTAELSRRIRSLVREHAAEVVVFGQGLPLSLLGPKVAGGDTPYVVLTHGVEMWMARVPGTRTALRRALGGARAVTAISEYTAEPVRRILPPSVPLAVVHPAVDEGRFSPSSHGVPVRGRHGLEGRPVVLCVSRLVPRKGQDVLIEGMPILRRMVPEAALLIVGGGPHRLRLEAMAAEAPPGSVVFAGEVADEELPSYYGACDVFAMPCRSRWGGLEVEGYGIVFLEAAASGKAVVAGRSGGAAEAVVDGVTGVLVEGDEPKAVALAVAKLLKYPELAAELGSAGRARVEAELTWRVQAERVAEILRRAVA